MNLNFKIRKGKIKSSIIAELNSINSNRVRVTTKFKIPNSSIRYWNIKKGRLKTPNDIINSKKINDSLNDYEEEITNKWDELYKLDGLSQTSCKRIMEEVITPSKFKKVVVKKNEDSFTDFIKYYEHYMDVHKTQVSEHTQKLLAKGTLKTLKNALSVLKGFLNGKSKLGFEEIDKSFMKKLIAYLDRQSLSLNYKGTIISKMGTILRASHNEGLHSNTIFNQKIFKRITEQVNHVYLNFDEINTIRDLKIDDEKLNDARDIFLIDCYTAMRVGDLVDFLSSDDKTILQKGNRGVIYYIQGKTQKEIYAPIHDDIEAILKRRGGKFPNYMHPNTLNKLIKIIARKAGINETVVIERTIGGVKTEFKKKKYHFITMHTGRRSFCSNADESGWKKEDIMLVSGHSSMKVLESYIKSTKEKKVERIVDNDFYKTRKSA